MKNAIDALQVAPSGRPLAATVRGIDFSQSISGELAAALRALWAEHLVLLFPGQTIDDEGLLTTADIFGGRQVAGSRAYMLKAGHQPGVSARVSKHEAISAVSNLDQQGKPVQGNEATGSLSLKWHSDNSYVETPPRGSLLHARVVPQDGTGKTSWNNQYLAYERLPTRLKDEIEGLHVCHDNKRNTAGLFRPTVQPPKTREDVNGPVHPIVRIHPDTGKRALYLGRHYEWPSSYIVELDDEASEALLAELWGFATHEDLSWTHEWTPGDLMLWDNRCTMHARSTIDHTKPRVLHRTLVKGEAVISPWAGESAQSA